MFVNSKLLLISLTLSALGAMASQAQVASQQAPIQVASGAIIQSAPVVYAAEGVRYGKRGKGCRSGCGCGKCSKSRGRRIYAAEPVYQEVYAAPQPVVEVRSEPVLAIRRGSKGSCCKCGKRYGGYYTGAAVAASNTFVANAAPVYAGRGKRGCGCGSKGKGGGPELFVAEPVYQEAYQQPMQYVAQQQTYQEPIQVQAQQQTYQEPIQVQAQQQTYQEPVQVQAQAQSQAQAQGQTQELYDQF